MNNKFNLYRETLVKNTITEIKFNTPAYEAIVKNFTSGDLRVFCGSDISEYSDTQSILIEAGMGQVVFINNINNGSEDSFDRLFFKSDNGGNIEVQVIGF